MSQRILLPPGWAAPIGYANGIATTPGRIVFVAGQVGWDAQQRFRSDELVPQFAQALQNVVAVLAEAGALPRHICRMTAYCTDKPAYLAGRPRARTNLAPAYRRALSGHDDDLRLRPARRAGQDRVGGDCSRSPPTRCGLNSRNTRLNNPNRKVRRNDDAPNDRRRTSGMPPKFHVAGT